MRLKMSILKCVDDELSKLSVDLQIHWLVGNLVNLDLPHV